MNWVSACPYHHAQHCYSTTLSHTANCCGRYKPLSAVLVTTFHTLPAVSWLRWWLCPTLLSV